MTTTVSDYEIIVDDVLLGDEKLKGETITYRINELPDDDRIFKDVTTERLFFLSRNPDNTFTAIGAVSVQNNRDGYYSYDSLASGGEREFTGRTLDFIENLQVEAFEELVRSEIRRIYNL